MAEGDLLLQQSKQQKKLTRLLLYMWQQMLKIYSEGLNVKLMIMLDEATNYTYGRGEPSKKVFGPWEPLQIVRQVIVPRLR